MRHSREDDTPLIIDEAASEIPSDDEIRRWARDKRVFISSVMSELREERLAAKTAVRAVGARPVLFEDFGGRDTDAEDAYIAEVASAHIYIGILGRRYGKPLPSRYSPTHAEYLEAERRGLRIAMWTATTEREGPQQSFLDHVRTFYVVPEFNSPTDLQQQIEERLRTIAAEDLAPWCKLSNVIFRATDVEDTGERIVVRGQVHGDEVAHALEALRPGHWRTGSASFTWRGRSRSVHVEAIQLTTTASSSQKALIRLKVVENPQDSFNAISFGNFRPDDLTEDALRTVIFGETSRLPRQYLGFIPPLEDPWQSLRQRPVSEESIRPIAELLLVDALVGSGRVGRVTHFKLGVRINGRRKCVLAWKTPRRYTNEKEHVQQLDGDVAL